MSGRVSPSRIFFCYYCGISSSKSFNAFWNVLLLWLSLYFTCTYTKDNNNSPSNPTFQKINRISCHLIMHSMHISFHFYICPSHNSMFNESDKTFLLIWFDLTFRFASIDAPDHVDESLHYRRRRWCCKSLFLLCA